MKIYKRHLTNILDYLYSNVTFRAFGHLGKLWRRRLPICGMFFILNISVTYLGAQCITPITDAGLYCDPDASVSGAPIICDLDCLDGFVASMPSNLLPDQPTSLCGPNGTPNNLSWFAFIAGDVEIDITITPSNCQPGSVFSGNPADNLIGIQTGIYSSCSFEEEDVVTCFWDCAPIGQSPVTLSSDQFIPGEIYYMFVDGCGGSVCDYTVTVNTAVQAFEIPDFTTISNEYNYDFDVDTICKGEEILFTLDDFDYDINYQWMIDPPIVQYPTGTHPVTDTNAVEFIFSDEGVFDIIVFAYSDCDANDPDTFQVVVKPLGDEIFTDVTLCEECITDGIKLISPDAGCIIGVGVPLILTEDPNGDGVPGWQGFTDVSGPGIMTNVVQNSRGCDYSQSVEIIEIPKAPVAEINLYFCSFDFPIDTFGFTFNSPGTSREIILENQAVSGCDSTLDVTTHGIDFFGSGTVSECVNGLITITFDISSIEPTNYDSIVYNWIDDIGNIVTDTDNIDNILEVVDPGTYSVEVTVYKEGGSCMQPFGNYNIDAASLIPADPIIAFAPNEICITEGQALIYLNNQGLGEDYEWMTDPVLPITYGVNNDTAYVDITSGQDFEFCILATNDCGDSELTCDDVQVSEVPSSEFIMQSEVCIDSTFWVEYSDPEGVVSTSEFYWSFDGANLLNIANPLGPGPFELQFDNTGVYNISMYLIGGGCESELEEQTILVTAPFLAPDIICHSMLNGVSFSFDDSVVDGFEVEVLTGQSFEIKSMDSIFVGNLGPEEDVEISILFNDDHVCGGESVLGTCMSLPCPVIGFDAILSNQDQCIDENSDPINLMMNIIGMDSGVGAWSSPFIDEDNVFNVLTAGVGTHDISYTYEVAGCSYAFDTSIYIYSSPVLEFDVAISYCEEDVISRLLIDADDNIFSVNGLEEEDSESVTFSEAGTYQLQLTNEYGCSTYEEVVIDPIIIDPSLIIGSTDLVAGNMVSFETNDIGPLPDLSYSWYLDGELLCEDCLSIEFEVEQDDLELCMVASYEDGCEQEVCVNLEVIVIAELYIPNVFSPNGDALNDYFKFQSNAQDLMIESISIFSRWGELMFQSSGAISNEDAIMWDGTYNGQPCNGGVYIYIIRYIDLQGNMVQESGDVTLLR